MPRWLRAFLRFFGFGPAIEEGRPIPTGTISLQLASRRWYPTIVFARHTGEGKPPRMQWKQSHPSTVRRFKAEVTCSQGHGIVLRDHSVEEDGQVIPSIVCKHPGCDFHEIVRLEGWDAGRMPAGASGKRAARV